MVLCSRKHSAADPKKNYKAHNKVKLTHEFLKYNGRETGDLCECVVQCDKQTMTRTADHKTGNERNIIYCKLSHISRASLE